MKLTARLVGLSVCAVIGLTYASKAFGTTTPTAVPKLSAELSAIEQQVAFSSPSQEQLDRLSEIIRQDGSNAQAHHALGMCFDKLGFRGFAAEQYVLVKKLDPAYAHLMVERFIKCMNEGNWPCATATSTFVRAAAPSEATLVFFDGILLEQARNYKSAMEVFQVAFTENPSIPGLPSAIAEIYARNGELKRALQMVSIDLSRQPKGFEPNMVAGRVLTSMGRYKEATGHLQVAYEANPNAPGVGFAFAQLLMKTGYAQKAAAACLVDMANQPKRREIEVDKELLKTIIPSLNGDSASKAIDAAAKKLRGSPNLPRMFFALADVYDRLGDYVDACLVRTEGLRLDRNYAHGYYKMGQSLERLDDYANAVKMYLTACTKDSGNQEYVRRLKWAAQRQLTFQNDLAAQLRRFLRSNILRPPGGYIRLGSDKA